MGNMNQQCPKCGNWVEGKKKGSYTKKIAKNGVKTAVNSAASVGAASTGAAIGTAILPGIGTVIGGAAGFIASTMFHTAVNEGIDIAADKAEDLMSDSIEYEFHCPKCGYEWTRNGNTQNIASSSYSSTTYTKQKISGNISSSSIRRNILKEIELCTGKSSLNEGCSLRYIGLEGNNADKFKKCMQQKYGVNIFTSDITSSISVKKLIDKIVKKLPKTVKESTPAKTHSTNTTDPRRTIILEIIKEVVHQSTLYEGCSCYFTGLTERDKARLLANELKKQYNADVSIDCIEKCPTIKDLIDQILAKNPYLSWTQIVGLNEESIDENSEEDSEQEAFSKQFMDFLNDQEIQQDKNRVEQFLRNMDKEIQKVHSDVVQSEYRFIQSLCCYYYVFEGKHDDPTLSQRGEHYIDEALNLLDDKEYALFKLIFRSMNIDLNAQTLVSQQKDISKNTPNFMHSDSNLLKSEYLLTIYEQSRCKSLLDSVDFLESRNRYKEAEQCLVMITQLSNSVLKSLGYYHLYKYYINGIGEIGKSIEKSFSYCKQVVELNDFSEDFDKENGLCAQWLECLMILGACYLDGEGTQIDVQKGIELTLKAANLGDTFAMYNLGEVYELGEGVPINLKDAILWYQKAAGLGNEEAQEKLKTLTNTSCSRKIELTDAESEYLEEVKACLEEDEVISPRERRLLNRLREKLGISEERAKELEESLKQPQLTTEEQEYFDEYKACLEDGNSISEKERRLLEKLRKMLGISEDRAKEIECL